MRKIENFENVKPSSDEVNNPQAGGYILVIKNIRDVEDKEYLKMLVDISEGEYKDHYQKLYEEHGFWGLLNYASYKTKAQGMFKRFIDAVEKSNVGYSWNWDEKSLKGKKIGAVLREEAYVSKNGEEKTTLRVHQVYTVEDIKKGNFKVPPKKELDENQRKQLKHSGNTTKEKDIQIDDDIQF